MQLLSIIMCSQISGQIAVTFTENKVQLVAGATWGANTAKCKYRSFYIACLPAFSSGLFLLEPKHCFGTH